MRRGPGRFGSRSAQPRRKLPAIYHNRGRSELTVMDSTYGDIHSCIAELRRHLFRGEDHRFSLFFFSPLVLYIPVRHHVDLMEELDPRTESGSSFSEGIDMRTIAENYFTHTVGFGIIQPFVG